MHIRPATRADSADIAILDDIASSGLATYVLEAGVRDGACDRPLEYGRDGYAFVNGPFSWKNVQVAELDGLVAGMSLSYPLTGGPDDSDLKDPVLEPLETLKAQAIGSRFIDSVAVYSRHRRLGIGKALVEAELARADAAVSIVTDSANHRAATLYQRLGFVEQARAPYIAFNDTATATHWVLLMHPGKNSRAHAAPHH